MGLTFSVLWKCYSDKYFVNLGFFLNSFPAVYHTETVMIEGTLDMNE